jgi:NAD(P)-dependent dehydrogenase (short-subunit alcohol dehydrogenase family)
MTIGVNYLGTYLLTELLIEKLEKSSKPKIIFVSSIICKFGKCRIREKFFKNRRKGLIAYDNSKLALMMYAMELDERLSEKGFVIKAVHPGIVYTHIFKWGTAFGEWIGGVQKWFFKSPEQGAAMQIMIATTDKYDDGHLYYKAYKKLKLPKQIKDADFRKRFIEFTQNLVESSRK